MDQSRLFAKLISMVVLWAIVWFFLHGEVYQPFLDSQFSASTACILRIVISFISLGAFMTAVVYLLFKKEDDKDFGSFFKIHRDFGFYAFKHPPVVFRKLPAF